MTAQKNNKNFHAWAFLHDKEKLENEQVKFCSKVSFKKKFFHLVLQQIKIIETQICSILTRNKKTLMSWSPHLLSLIMLK